MKWKKLGIVYSPRNLGGWAQNAAMIPTPIRLNENVVRVFVSFCDKNGIGRPGYVDLDPHDLTRVLKVSLSPLIDIGKPGTFDDNGAVVCSIVNLGHGVQYMYYVGFELCTKIRYRLFTGLAISEDNGETFKKYKTAPILDRTSAELMFRCGPCVLHEDDKFKLWYIAGSDWANVNDKQMPVYVLKYLESEDGLHWGEEGQLSMDISNPDEHGFGRPWVTRKADGGYAMHYSIRKRSLGAYRLGYAESKNGLDWIRDDERIGLDVTPGSFDSEAIMYSATINLNGQVYCFYNGNGFGKDGFAVARLLEG